jgi:hypothetical protein
LAKERGILIEKDLASNLVPYPGVLRSSALAGRYPALPGACLAPLTMGCALLKGHVTTPPEVSNFVLSSPAGAVHRLIELLNLQWLLQNRDRTDLKNPIEDLAIRVTCDHDNVARAIALRYARSRSKPA